jgi:hypothetical protein
MIPTWVLAMFHEGLLRKPMVVFFEFIIKKRKNSVNSLLVFDFSDQKQHPTAFLTLKFMYKKFYRACDH